MTLSMVTAGDRLLASIGEGADRVGTGALTLHWPLAGRAFDGGVLVIGQAVYGWFGDWTAVDAATSTGRTRIIDDAQRLFDDRPDRMDWLDGHRVWNSPFWRVARAVTDALVPGAGPAYARMAWGNLYPVAPNDTKANPSGAVLEAQRPFAPAFVDAMVSTLRPAYVLVVGGPYVWNFVEPLGLITLDRQDPPLYLAGRRGGVPWVVGMHPGGASRRGHGPTAYASHIVSTFEELSS
jgi:hypothetical protein